MRADRATQGTSAHSATPAASAGPVASAAAEHPAASGGAHAGADAARNRRSLNTVLWVIAVALAALAIITGLRLFLPSATQPVWVQFSDLSGRVQLEYCPSLPASFEGIARSEDLRGGSSVIPVKVTADVCGDAQFQDGVWIYLHRSSVTVASRSPG